MYGMFILRNQLTLSRTIIIKHSYIVDGLMSKRKRKIMANNVDKQHNNAKRNKLGNTPTMAQAGSSCSISNRDSVPALSTGNPQESINVDKKGKRRKSKSENSLSSNENLTANQHIQQSSFVFNPFYQLCAWQHFLTANYQQQRQLSNVSVNRNAKTSGRGTANSVSNNEILNETIGTFIRKWQHVEPPPKTDGEKGGIEFSLMSYNVLAQDLLDKHPELYKNHGKKNLSWQSRWQRLLTEIKHHNSDIVCLQEVQESHLNTYYTNNLTHLGYEGIFKKRTGNFPDGCAIYYKWDVFKLIEHTSVEFYQMDTPLLNRNNVGLIAKFAPLRNVDAEFIVATTHLLYNPKRNDVRVAQLQLFLAEIERMAYKNRSNTNYIPIILTGDFNSLPESPPLNFINFSNLSCNTLSKNKFVPETVPWIPADLGVTDNCQHFDLVMNRLYNMNISRDDEMKLIHIRHSSRQEVPRRQNMNPDYFQTGTLRHNFTFNSVYLHKSEATTYQNEWITVDYIFYSSKKDGGVNMSGDKLILLSRYMLPTNGRLNNVTIPNKNLGSDHLALLAKFKLVF